MVGSFKYLGIILDTKFNFNEHPDYIFKKAMLRLTIIFIVS